MSLIFSYEKKMFFIYKKGEVIIKKVTFKNHAEKQIKNIFLK